MRLLSPLTDELAPIFFGRKPATHSCKLCLGEGHSPTTALTWNVREGRSSGPTSGLRLDLYEAGFGARGDLAGKLYSVTHVLFRRRRLSAAVLILLSADLYQSRIAGPKIAISDNRISETINPAVIASPLVRL